MSRLATVGMICGVVAAVCPVRAAPELASTNVAAKIVEDQGFMVDDTQDVYTRLELTDKPASFDSWGQRFDFIQNNLTAEMQGYIDGADRIFVKDTTDLQPVPSSRFRLGTHVELEKDGGIKLRFSPDFKTDIKIPNLEQSLNVFIDTATSGELPGTSPTDRDPGFNAGLRKATDYFNFDAGVKVTWLPELFARADWRPQWSVSGWQVYPVQRFYWESEDGYGSVTSLDFNKLIGKRWMIKSTSAVRWREISNDGDGPPEDPEEFFSGDLGFEWEQSVTFGYVHKLISVKDRGRVIHFDQAADATGIRATAFGHTEGGYSGPDRYRVSLGHRRPIYKNWIFLVIVPEVEWYKEFDWEFVPRIRVGFDMLFQAEAIERPSR
jgi:hypothetical protein